MARKVPPILAITLLAVVVVILAGCAGGRSITKANGCGTQHHGGPQHPAGHPRRHQAMPSTHPNGAAPPGVGARGGRQPRQHKLWTTRWLGGVINTDPDYVDKDDSIHMKFGWCAGSADGCRSRVVGWMRRPRCWG